MFRNYLVIALRSLRKNSIPAFVNVFGLSIAIAGAIVVYLFLERAYTMDRFHEDGDRIFLVENVIERSGSKQLWGDSPVPLGPAMQRDVSQVESAIRIAYGGAVFQKDDLVFREGFWYVDPGFLDMFSFDIAAGSVSTLSEPGSIVISDALAHKYFGTEDPIGKPMTLVFSPEVTSVYTVGAVSAPFPSKASFTFNALLPYDRQNVLGVDPTDWSKYTGATFLRVTDPAAVDGLLPQMDRYRQMQNASQTDWPIAEFRLANLYDLSVQSEDVQGDISGGTHPTAIIVLGLVALFLLALSCFNYINLSVANASRRIKEIGVRKVVGGSKSQLVGQFLSENIVLCILALGLGFLIAWALFIPGFNALFDFVGGGVALEDAGKAGLFVFLGILLLVTGLLSGSYPAFYIASFRPTAIFRGSQTVGKGNLFTKSLLAFQFVLAFLTMIMGVVLAQNASYQADRDWGYDSDHELVVYVESGDEFERLRSRIEPLADVSEVVGARNAFAQSWNRPVVTVEGEEMEAVRFEIGPGYMEHFDMTLLSGRTLGSEPVSEAGTDVVINQTFATARGWSPENALERSFRQDSLTFTVVGVVQDFLYDSFYDPLEPAFLRRAAPAEFRYLNAAVAAGSGSRVNEAVEGIWKELFPARPYTGYFQDEVFDEMYRENTNIKQLFSFIAGLALLIACLGLFGLAVQNVVRRMREISIRKVLGASVVHIARTVNTGFLILIVVAFVIATPLGYFAMQALLNSVYPDPVPVGPFAFVLSFLLVFVAALFTVSTQVLRVASNSPAEVLRSE